ncbi:hypothetical protein KFE25_000777 [Diacronema lutheri]|uniref:F-box/LRR-repeat protein 15-like leucin rich repeat domain-containing protein n=1 Tax=Diacronema lutheri TaxID=2081491 RepID=A0A8J5XR22_DIALT|nr:hypothetical protein KFE25_000777 [Diacronema lutheri]
MGSSAREVPGLAALCLASVARHAPRALARAHTLPLDERCFEQLMRALKADAHAVTDELLLALLRPGATELDLARCVQVTDAGLRRAAPRLARVRRVDLSGVGVTDGALGALLAVPARVDALVLARCRQLTDGVVRAFSRRCLPVLVELNLAMCRQLGNDAVACVLEHAHALRRLDLSGLPRLDDGCYAAGSAQRDATLHGLHVLRLAQCRQLTDAGLAAIFAITRSLREADASDTAAAELTAGALAEACGGSLYALELAGCARLPADALPLLLVGCAALRTLALARCPALTAMHFQHSSHSLRTIDVSFCPLPHDALVDVAVNCPDAVSLGLRGSSELRDETVRLICAACADLEAIDVGHCAQLTDGAARALADGCPNLTSVRLDGSARMGDEAVAVLADSCARLSVLSVAHCARVTGGALHALARHSHFLRELDVSHCAALTEPALVHLARHSAWLESVRADGCAWLTADGLGQLVAACARLRRLGVSRCARLNAENVALALRAAPLLVEVETEV